MALKESSYQNMKVFVARLVSNHPQKPASKLAERAIQEGYQNYAYHTLLKGILRFRQENGLTPSRSIDNGEQGVPKKQAKGTIEKYEGDQCSLEGGENIKTLAQLIDTCNIDLELWEIDKHVVNKWDTTMSDGSGGFTQAPNFQIKAWLSKRLVDTTQETLESLRLHIQDYTQPQLKLRKSVHGSTCAIINLFDAHIDKLSVLAETDHNSSIEKNLEVFETAFDELLSNCARYKPETLYFPIGNDFFNTNDSNNTTKKGTPQDVMLKSEDAFTIGVNLLRRCIDKAAQVAHVIVPVIKGNHDEEKVFYLGNVMDMVYETNPNVTIDSTRHQRKYYQYGENMFCFAHGDKEKRKIDNLPLVMAEEEKEMWANTKYREIYMGDIHHKQEFKFMRGKDFVGVMVRFLRGITSADKWHTDNGYIGVPKTGEAFIWKKVGGMSGNFMVNI